MFRLGASILLALIILGVGLLALPTQQSVVACVEDYSISKYQLKIVQNGPLPRKMFGHTFVDCHTCAFFLFWNSPACNNLTV
jgi:hypothetical protein